MLRVTIARWGSTGDVQPYLAVGWALARRGHAVTFVGNPVFAASADNAGLAFVPVGSEADHKKLMADEGIWDRDRKTPEAVYRDHYYPHLRDYYQAAETLWAAANPGVVVVGEAAVASAAEQRGIPRVYMACSPGASRMTQSRFDPTHPERLLPRWAQWIARSGTGLGLLYGLNNLRHRRAAPAGSPVISNTHPITQLRSEKGLPPLPDRAPSCICLWPDWYAPPQRDWPEDAVVTDFPFYPRPAPASSADSRRSAPIVVTTGSLAVGQGNTYATAVAACRALDRPAILVTPNLDQIPANLPSSITHVTQAPFNELFTRASLVVHHGGIGTASYALAAGVPQIVMPMRGDQFDNANRLQRLGIARMLSRQVSARQLARTIDGLLGSVKVAARCLEWQARIDPDKGLQRAADRIESLAKS